MDRDGELYSRPNALSYVWAALVILLTVEAVNAAARETETDILTLLADPARIAGIPRAAAGPLLSFRAQIESIRSTMGVLRPSELLDHVVG